MLGWLVAEKIRYGKSTALGAASGAVAGLVAITPCAGWVSPFGSIFIGFIAGFACAYAISLKNKIGLDDSLDVGGVHFVGGWIGTLMVGFFSTKGIEPARQRRQSSTAAVATTVGGMCWCSTRSWPPAP